MPWKREFETSPCLGLDSSRKVRSKPNNRGNVWTSGGRCSWCCSCYGTPCVLMNFTVCPHAFYHVSLCISPCVLMRFQPCVLMHLTMCPHAFLTITRYHLKSPNYKYFYNFDFEDYLQRNRVIRTYDIRFLKMTQGKSRDTFGLKDPPEWGLGEEMVVTNSKATRAKRASNSPASSSSASGWFLFSGISVIVCVLILG